MVDILFRSPPTGHAGRWLHPTGRAEMDSSIGHVNPPPADIAREFRALDRRFRDYASRTDKVSWLNQSAVATAMQAGRLLVCAIDAGAFPQSREETNGAWWDRAEGRVPGWFDTVQGGLHWHKGEPPPHESPEYRRRATEEWTASQHFMCWISAVDTWLVPAFKPSGRFREDADRFNYRRIVFDKDGHPLGRDGKPLEWRWFKGGKPMPPDFEPDFDERPFPYGGELVGDVAHRDDSYDNQDWLEHQRIRCGIYADACRLLADLVESSQSDDEGEEDTVDCLVTLNQMAPLTGLSKRTLERKVKDRLLPPPDVRGGGGHAHKWYWKNIRPALSKFTMKPLRENFPGSHIVSR